MDEDEGGGGHEFRFHPILVGLLGVIAGSIVVATCHLVYSIYNCYGRPTVDVETAAGTSENVDRIGHERPRVISASASTIPRLIPIFRYNKDCNEDMCAICLGDFKEGEQIRVLPDCFHFFHVGCIDKWLNSHSNCPICRADALSSPPREVVVSLPDSSGTLSMGVSRLQDFRM